MYEFTKFYPYFDRLSMTEFCFTVCYPAP